MIWVNLVLGIVLMSIGADWVVGGVSKLSRRLRISTFIVSVLILGIGDNIPEIIMTFKTAGTSLEPSIIPDIVTSNIFNILGIVGLAAVFYPIVINNATKREINMLLFSAALLTSILYDGKLDFAEGILLFIVFFCYMFSGYRPHANRYLVSDNKDTLKTVSLIAGGVALLYFGSDIFYSVLTKMMTMFHLDGSALGVLIVAPGTSGPEIIITILSIIRKKTSILVGNMVGSCIMHALLIAAIAGTFVEPTTGSLDYIIMMLATIMFAIDIGYRHKISRFSGFIYLTLLCLYFRTVLV